MNVASSRGETRNQAALDLWQRMKTCESAGDKAGYDSARASLYEMFESLAFSIVARLLSQQWLSPEDMRQECRMAVIQAIDRWNPERGELPVLLTYVTRKRMREYLRNHELIRRTHSVFQSHWQETRHGRSSPETARINILSFTGSARLSDPGLGERESGEELSEFLRVPGDDPYEQVQLRLAIEQALDYLQPQERQSVSLYFGLDGHDPRTYREVAPLINASYQTVKNRVERALPVLAAVLDGCR